MFERFRHKTSETRTLTPYEEEVARMMSEFQLDYDTGYICFPMLGSSYPMPFLCDSDGHPVDVDGSRITTEEQFAELSPVVRSLMAEAGIGYK